MTPQQRIEAKIEEFENLPNTQALTMKSDGSFVMRGNLIVDWLREAFQDLLTSHDTQLRERIENLRQRIKNYVDKNDDLVFLLLEKSE